MGVLPTCMSINYMHSYVLRGQEVRVDALGLEWRMVVKCCVVVETEPRSSTRAAGVNYQAISPALNPSIPICTKSQSFTHKISETVTMWSVVKMILTVF